MKFFPDIKYRFKGPPGAEVGFLYKIHTKIYLTAKLSRLIKRLDLDLFFFYLKLKKTLAERIEVQF